MTNKYSEVKLETKDSVQALSPGGKHLPKELEEKQKLINIKLEALEQAT